MATPSRAGARGSLAVRCSASRSGSEWMSRVLLEESGMSRRFVAQPLRLARALAIGAPAAAHHSFAVHFVADKLIDVSGTVAEFSFRNPHGLLVLTAKDANGKDQQWKIETNSPNILRRRGWSETSIKPGDLVTV